MKLSLNLKGKNSNIKEICSKPIAQYDLNKKLIKIFSSGKEAAKPGYRPQSIREYIKGDRSYYAGFIWKNA